MLNIALLSIRLLVGHLNWSLYNKNKHVGSFGGQKQSANYKIYIETRPITYGSTFAIHN